MASTTCHCAFCIVSLNLISRSLLTPSAPLHVLPLLIIPPLPLSVLPPFAALNIANVPVETCGCYLLGSVYPPQFPQTTPLPCRPKPAAWSRTVPRRVVSKLPVLLFCAPSFPSPMMPHLLIYSGGLSYWAPFCALMRGHGLSTTW